VLFKYLLKNQEAVNIIFLSSAAKKLTVVTQEFCSLNIIVELGTTLDCKDRL
jgi:hypothetical protein